MYPKFKKNKILIIIIQKNLLVTAWHFYTVHITGQELQGGKTCSQNTWRQAWHLHAVAFSKSVKAWQQLKFSVFILNNRCGFHSLHQHSGVEHLRVKRPSKSSESILNGSQVWKMQMQSQRPIIFTNGHLDFMVADVTVLDEGLSHPTETKCSSHATGSVQ